MYKKAILKRTLVGIMAGSMLLAGCGKKNDAQPATGSSDATSSSVAVDTSATDQTTPELDGYNLVWSDEFNGTEMDFDTWSYDPHEPGWTNHELQEYTTSTANVYVSDGNLHLRAIKTEDDKGKPYYTSGKVKSQDKQDFMYGKVEVRAKVPRGQGLWPAIWMMPTDEMKYGQWPKCGEIDIMEVLCSDTTIAYGTVHYGAPHAEQQGTVVKTTNDYADDYHVYSVEWEPGEIRWYIDDEEYLVVNDWFTAEEGQDDKPYPAPFDQDFYVQLNLAVGGDWPGNPDDTTDFENAVFDIDYVRVYQKPEYDTNVEKPAKVFKEADENGNYITNGDFADDTDLGKDLAEGKDWTFLLFEGGEGSAEIKDGTMIISTENMGTVDYSVQLVQPNLPMIKGNKYKVTFDAKADETRDIIVAVTAPNAGWIRYLEDTKLEVTTDYQTYTYEFEMTEKDDNNGRLEFNLGNRGSDATVYIQNVKVELVEE